MRPYISGRLPVITSSIEFFRKSLGPPPPITPEINFGSNTPSQHAQPEEDDIEMIEITDMISTPVPDNNNVEDFLNRLDDVFCKFRSQVESPGDPAQEVIV